jgi:putative zinc finger/helix-turn-helix YgiT family protein
MNCPDCGAVLVSSRENHLYEASGLPNVTLANVEVRRCGKCGEFEVVIPKLEQLHRVLAQAVAMKKSRLTAAEIRFLRKYLGWSGVDFAKHMGVAAETVSRWENDREPMGPVADRLLRMMVAVREPVSNYSLDALMDLEDTAKPVRVTIEAAKNGWRVGAC